MRVLVMGLIGLAASAKAMAQVPGMTMEQDVGRPGSEYAAETVANPEQCAQRCLDSAGCASYAATPDSASFHCSLKDAIAAPVPSPGQVSGIKQGDSLSVLSINMGNHGSQGGVPWETRFARVADWMARTRVRPISRRAGRSGRTPSSTTPAG